jgi:trehalose 6-phosphate phosphatase
VIATPIEELLAPLLAEPARAAAFFDLDGTLAEIVERPEGTALPERSRRLLERVAARFGAAGIVTGRRAAEALGIAGVGGLTIIGNHGLEILPAGEREARVLPEAGSATAGVRELVAALDPAELTRAGLRIEDKGPIVALHWRGAADEGEAERVAAAIGERATASGLATHRGRKVLELRPDLPFDKGRGLAALLAGSGLRAAFYAGDDRTDVDAFRALARLREDGELDAIARVGVLSPETPAVVAEHADVTVEGPDGFLAVLELLAGEGG